MNKVEFITKLINLMPAAILKAIKRSIVEVFTNPEAATYTFEKRTPDVQNLINSIMESGDSKEDVKRTLFLSELLCEQYVQPNMVKQIKEKLYDLIIQKSETERLQQLNRLKNMLRR